VSYRILAGIIIQILADTREMVTDTLRVMSMVLGLRVRGTTAGCLYWIGLLFKKEGSIWREKNISETPSPYLYSNPERYLSGAYDDALEEVS
jgi:hypothetical protein